MRLLTSILVNGLLVFLASKLLSGVFVENYLVAVVTGLVLGLVNFVVKPLIILLTLPVTILTLGLFLLIINGAMVMLADWLVAGFDVQSMGWAIMFSLLLVLFNFILGKYGVSEKAT